MANTCTTINGSTVTTFTHSVSPSQLLHRVYQASVWPWFTELICAVLSSFTPSPSTITMALSPNSPIPLFKAILHSLPWVRKIVNWQQLLVQLLFPVQRSTVAVPCLEVNNSHCSLFRGQQQSLFPVQRSTTVTVPCSEVNNSPCSEVNNKGESF